MASSENSKDAEPEDQFAHFFDECTKHEKSVAEEGKVSIKDLYEKLENPKAAAEEKSSGGAEKAGEIASGSASFEERSLLEEARKVLREYRCCVMYSCVYSYNLTDKTQKSIFKVNADYLQPFVWKLSEFLEKDVHKISDNEKRRKIMRIIKFCNNRRKKIVTFIEVN